IPIRRRPLETRGISYLPTSLNGRSTKGLARQRETGRRPGTYGRGWSRRNGKRSVHEPVVFGRFSCSCNVIEYIARLDPDNRDNLSFPSNVITGMTSTPRKSLTFDNPPVIETVLGVHFAPL